MSHMLLTNGRTLSDSSHFSGAGNRGHKELLLDSTISDEEHLAIPHNKQFPEVATPKTKAEKDIVKLASNITLKPHHILLKHIYSTASRLQNYKVEENKNIPVSETLEGTLNNNNVNVFLLDLNVDRSPDMLYDINVKPKITEPSEDSGKCIFFIILFLLSCKLKPILD